MRFLVVAVSLCMLACAPDKGGIIIAGSTSVQPFIEKVADRFMEKNPGIKVNVQGGGSTAGIQATLNGTCDIGTSSRDLKPDEKSLKVVLVAVDGIAVIVHRDNPVVNLTVEQIRQVFTGRIKDWQELGGPEGAIIPVTREEGSGTRASFEELIMGDEAISDACLVQDSNGAVREIIATTLQGIGYVSVGLVDEREKAIAIDGVMPTLDNLTTERYGFSRPFLLLLREEPHGNARTFIEYVQSSEGQQILESGGLIPANKIASDR